MLSGVRGFGIRALALRVGADRIALGISVTLSRERSSLTELLDLGERTEFRREQGAEAAAACQFECCHAAE